MSISFIEYTDQIIGEFSDGTNRILVIGPGYTCTDSSLNHNIVWESVDDKYIDPKPMIDIPRDTMIIQNNLNMDIIEWFEAYKHSYERKFNLFDVVIMCRVFEHIEMRRVDYFLYSLYSMLSVNSTVICTVPDMVNSALQLEEEYRKDKPDAFKIQRLTFELFNEGPSVRDRHALWSSKSSIKYLFERENLFKFNSVNKIELDTNLVPNQLEFRFFRN